MAAVHLRCQQLQLAYKAGPVLQGLTLQVPPGQMAAVLGPAGAGKSALLRVVAGLDTPQAGQVWFNDTNVTAVSPRQRRVGLLFPGDALWPHLTVGQHVALPLAQTRLGRAERRERVTFLLELLGLAQAGDALPDTLSLPDQQRLALARALAAEPQVLLLDEPTAALPREQRAAFRQQIKVLQQQLGVTAVLATQDPHEAMALGDHLGLLHQGRWEQEGTPASLYDAPASTRVAQSLGSINLLPAAVLSRTEERLVLAVDGLRDLVLPVADDTPATDRVVLGFRPHAVQVLAGSSRGETRFQWESGVVVRSEFHGAYVRYDIVVGPHVLSVDQPHYRGEEWIAPNTVVMVGLEVAQMRLLAE